MVDKKEIDLTPGQDWQSAQGRPGEPVTGSNFWPFVGYFAAFFAAAWAVNQFLR